MLESLAFVTRARTVDHLGRGQIADCPTAISELWKNSYDAYAKTVTLHIFDGKTPVAALCDDGHGMNKTEFVEKWLVVGTESKASGNVTPQSDRNGLRYRPKQGQKGIGRLSSGYLGPLLLLISKRQNDSFVASLIDWRMFENPYLLLHDVEIPVTTFESKEQLPEIIDEMLTKLVDNLWGHGEQIQRARIKEAWENFDQLESSDNELLTGVTTKQRIEQLLIESPFEDQHLNQWPVWNGGSPAGTILLVADIDFDLRAQLQQFTSDSTTERAKKKFFEILSSFSDPFPNPGLEQAAEDTSDFRCSVVAWTGGNSKTIIGKEKEFDLSVIQELEHVIDGRIDDAGTFRGRVKAFGNWLEGEILIPIHGNLDLPTRSDTKVGGFNLYIAAMEFDRQNSTHTSEQHARFKAMSKLYSGFMIYRDGLRVMPYGRSSNDFFEIEQRRSRNAGREFWNLRQMFGRIAITRYDNPNLKDKAGREGLIDNRSAKGLKDIVENILKTSARRYFGSQSDIRSKTVPDLKADYTRQREEEERKKLAQQQRRVFNKNLENWSSEIPSIISELNYLRDDIDRNYSLLSEESIMQMREKLFDLKEKVDKFKLGTAPKKLGIIEEKYKNFRANCAAAKSTSSEIADRLQTKIVELKPKAPGDLAKQELQRHCNQIRRKIRTWSSRVQDILNNEEKRLQNLADERINDFQLLMSSIVSDVINNRLPLAEAFETFESERESLDAENEDLYLPYITALESLQMSIDLSSLASSGSAELNDLREELDRLTALAQLGITIEIIGHELEGFDAEVTSGINSLPPETLKSKAVERIKNGHEGLTERLRFLAPLKLSGPNSKDWITGFDIFEYVSDFFGHKLEQDSIELYASPEFRGFSIFENKSRIYPVFVNLVNNSRYWVCQKKGSQRRISMDVLDEKVIVSDNGPGVEDDDVKSLFKLFFTRKTIGGRGVGLYLCKANLGASGHRIDYARGEKYKLLSGANFVISFSGASFE